MKNTFMFIFLLLPFLFSCSNYGVIEGKVIDKLTGQPISGATITIVGTTNKSITESDGTFKLIDVVPGFQKISVAKDSFITFTDTELTIAKGTTFKCSDLFLVKKPNDIGLYLIGKSLKQINLISEKKVGRTFNNDIIIYSSNIYNPEKLDSINFLLFEGDNIQKPSEIFFYTMKFLPHNPNSFIVYPERWISEEKVQGVKTELLSNSLVQITGKLPIGRYCLQVKHEHGIKDWFFVFDSK